MARYGYGLLLPEIRADYRLGPALLGAIATGSYVSYLTATAFAGAIAARIGARRCAVAAGLLAPVGMIVAGMSRSAGLFAAGILVAGASAGLAFAPFAEIARGVPAPARGRVLAAVNCGTGYGVALSAPIAILVGVDWRSAWLAFAAVAVLASAVMFGAAYNATVAIQVIWSAHVFAQRPSLGVSAVFSANGLGLLLGPLGAGLLAGPLGLGPVLLLGAGLVATASLLAPRESILPTA